MIKLVLKDSEFVALCMGLMKVTPAQWDDIANILSKSDSWKMAKVENWVQLMDFLHHFPSTTHNKSV